MLSQNRHEERGEQQMTMMMTLFRARAATEARCAVLAVVGGG